MHDPKFKAFLSELGFSEDDIRQHLESDTFSYRHKLTTPDQTYATDVCIKYILVPKENLERIVRDKHTDLWNENRDNVLVVVSEQNTFLLNTKVKPNYDNALHTSVVIENFSYGTNSVGYADDELRRLKDALGKDSVDSAYFFNFVIEKTKQHKENKVDKDLLLNLIQLRNDLLKIRNAPETIHLLILRCLFIKYLEDRGVYEKEYLKKTLETGSAQKLLAAFEEIKKINGDIFKTEEFSAGEIQKFLGDLAIFFSCFDYRTKQQTLFFPYKFDKIPIQLISHVYEAFLSSAQKGSKGVFYTPAFVVRFMLSHTVQVKLQTNKNATVLDPACGSGAFLVEAFKEIVRSNNAENDYEKKVDILKKQLFGIDIDKQALQIAAFSLYLSLLEGENPEDIQKKIKDSYPILPSLLDRSLIVGNSLVDNIYPAMTFDCIVANPPWGSVNKNGDVEDKRERKAITQKGKVGELSFAGQKIAFPEYKNVSDYQRAQAFLMRINKWCNDETICSLIVNSPIFLNEKADLFRKDLLTQYRLTHFYELSHLNEILFKKQEIGEIKNSGRTEKIEIGSSEPCVVVVFDKKESCSHEVQYVSPKLTDFSKSFELVHFTRGDMISVKQKDLLTEDDWLWRIFVNGSWSDYQLIKKTYINDEGALKLQCRSGIKPKANAQRVGRALYFDMVEPKHIKRYIASGKFKKFNYNQEMERSRVKKIFLGKRILFPIRPLKSDKLRIRGVRVDGGLLHKHNISCIRILRNGAMVTNYAPFLALLNSSFLGYYIYHISSQWGKGEEKRSALRNSDIEKLPFPSLQRLDEKFDDLTSLVVQIEAAKKVHEDTSDLENKIDEMVFDLYELLEHEKETIREFYQINVEREGDTAAHPDLQRYVNKFREVFNFILADHLALNASYRISANLGAYVVFSIVQKEEMRPEVTQDLSEDRQLLDMIKKEHLGQTFFSHRLNEDKVKAYTDDKFFVFKSNYFKDWTTRQAMHDANEEIGLILKRLPPK